MTESEMINLEKYNEGIEYFEVKFNLKIAEDCRAILLTLVRLQNVGKLHFPFLGLPLNRAENSYGEHLDDVPYELMRYDLFSEDLEGYTNPFEVAEEVIEYSGHRGIFPIARGRYGDGYDLLYFKQRMSGQLERIVSIMREGSRMGFLSINLKLVRGALLLKDVEEVEQTLGYTIDPIFYADDLKYSKLKEEKNLAKQVPSANKRTLDYYCRLMALLKMLQITLRMLYLLVGKNMALMVHILPIWARILRIDLKVKLRVYWTIHLPLSITL